MQTDIKDLIGHVMNDDMVKANELFGSLLSTKQDDAVEAMKQSMAQNVYDGVELEVSEEPMVSAEEDFIEDDVEENHIDLDEISLDDLSDEEVDSLEDDETEV
jgi:hypothetical protein